MVWSPILLRTLHCNPVAHIASPISHLKRTPHHSLRCKRLDLPKVDRPQDVRGFIVPGRALCLHRADMPEWKRKTTEICCWKATPGPPPISRRRALILMLAIQIRHDLSGILRCVGQYACLNFVPVRRENNSCETRNEPRDLIADAVVLLVPIAPTTTAY